MEHNNWATTCAFQQYNIQATSKGSDHPAHMRRMFWAFVGRTYHIVWNLMSRLNHLKRLQLLWTTYPANWRAILKNNIRVYYITSRFCMLQSLEFLYGDAMKHQVRDFD